MVNYIVDLIIAVGFVLVAFSGVVLLLAGPGGYRGGVTPRATHEVFSLSRWTWKALHVWSAMGLAGGVALHLLLHRKWFVCMNRNLLHRADRANQNSALKTMAE